MVGEGRNVVAYTLERILKYLRYEILALAAVVLAGAMQLEAGAPTKRPARPSSTRKLPAKAQQPVTVVAAPKVYPSLSGLLARIPKKLTEGAGEKLSPSQSDAINQWLTKNIPSGSMLALTGRFAGSSGGETGVSLSFKHTSISIHGKKLGLQASADLDGKFAKQVARLNSGSVSKGSGVGGKKSGAAGGAGGASIVVHGKIATLAIAGGELRVSVRDGGIGRIPSSAYGTTKQKPTARPTLKPTAKPTRKPAAKPKLKPAAEPAAKPEAQPVTQTPEQKAGRQLRLAKMYLGFGKKAKTIEILKGIVADYPETDAAKTAASQLKKLQGDKGAAE